MAQLFFSNTKKLGILGGGQLGRMLIPTLLQWDIHTKILDPDEYAPCRAYGNEFVQGDLQDFDTVYNFGKDCDVITIEIEKVNTDALLQLQAEGKIIHPNPNALSTIQDKGLQKIFYASHNFPTPDFHLFDSTEDLLRALHTGVITFPFVQKLRRDGYDGKGVCVVNDASDLENLLPGQCLVENKINIAKELAVIAARNEQGDVKTFEVVEMEFHAGANMLDLLLYPAPVSVSVKQQVQELAGQLIRDFDICGLLAVEFLMDVEGKIWINEVAPRPHNSGHQTIESAVTSQYEQHIRAILNLPLGDTQTLIPSAMVNIIGEPNTTGPVYYEGIETCMQAPGVHIHLYGKSITKPFRKMGHVTVVHQDLETAKNKAIWIRETLRASSR